LPLDDRQLAASLGTAHTAPTSHVCQFSISKS
jgi:hypothetical protein